MLHGIIMQGTTPKQSYELPFSTSLLDKVSITYRQKGVTILKKEMKDCQLSENKIIVSLSQEETMMFSPLYIVNVQLKIKALGGEVQGSEEYRLSVKEIFDKEVF
jgi:hypothetical protein